MKKLRILLADDHVVMRKGLRALLERQSNLEVVGESENGRETIDLAASLIPDVVVMDVGMPVLNGIEATKTIVTQNPQISVVILSMHVDESYVMRALKAGARGYLLKDSAPGDLMGAIQAVSQNKSFFSPKVSHILAEDYVRVLKQKGAVDSYDLLTTREREILQLIAEGSSNKEIAAALNISLYTVETHRSHILEKLNLHNPAELILYAVRKGIIS
jgi:two-component system, NarL family, response regulator NreC